MDSFLWKVDFYETKDGKSPVEEFVTTLPIKDQLKVNKVIHLLRSMGIKLHMPHSRVIEGVNNLFELRIQLGNNIRRIFYFHYTHRTFILLHAFTKKTQRTPSNQIEIALKHKKDYLMRKSK